MENIDPATKQYIIFSLIVSIILAAIINFVLVEMVANTFAYGFPINLKGAEGFSGFISRVINTVVQGLILSPMVYYGLKYLQNRR